MPQHVPAENATIARVLVVFGVPGCKTRLTVGTSTITGMKMPDTWNMAFIVGLVLNKAGAAESKYGVHHSATRPMNAQNVIQRAIRAFKGKGNASGLNTTETTPKQDVITSKRR